MRTIYWNERNRTDDKSRPTAVSFLVPFMVDAFGGSSTVILRGALDSRESYAVILQV